MRVVLATTNLDKVREITEILGGAVELVPRPAGVPDVDETGDTLEANARLKARALCEATGLPALADDTGLDVDALGGAPGVYSSRYAGPEATYADNVWKLVAELRGETNRRARFRTVAMVAFPDGTELVGEGVVDGTITEHPRGDGGFGFDPVFVPDEDPAGRTFAEMPAADKHAVSHRGRAVRAVAAALANVGP